MFAYDYFEDDEDDWEEEIPLKKEDDLKECEKWLRNQKV